MTHAREGKWWKCIHFPWVRAKARARGCAKLFEQKWLEKVDFFKMTFFLENGCHEALQYKRAPSADASEHQI